MKIKKTIFDRKTDKERERESDRKRERERWRAYYLSLPLFSPASASLFCHSLFLLSIVFSNFSLSY
jgi:hypothetical protein